MVHLLLVESSKHAAVFQVAPNVVAGDPIADDPSAFKCHFADQLGGRLADAALNAVEVSAVAVDDLPAVATGCAEANLHGFQNGDAEALLEQEQGSGQTGVTGANDAHVDLMMIS